MALGAFWGRLWLVFGAPEGLLGDVFVPDKMILTLRTALPSFDTICCCCCCKKRKPIPDNGSIFDEEKLLSEDERKNGWYVESIDRHKMSYVKRKRYMRDKMDESDGMKHKKGEIFRTWEILRETGLHSYQLDLALKEMERVGKSKFIFGTGKYKELIGTECIYAVKLLDDSAFSKHKCELK